MVSGSASVFPSLRHRRLSSRLPARRSSSWLRPNFFAYGGRYYTFHEGAWFVATTYGSPWETIAPARVPRPVLAVPVAYYKVPPGHAKKMGCPPGLAKQGRC